MDWDGMDDVGGDKGVGSDSHCEYHVTMLASTMRGVNCASVGRQLRLRKMKRGKCRLNVAFGNARNGAEDKRVLDVLIGHGC